jgi:hypothetical protein
MIDLVQTYLADASHWHNVLGSLDLSSLDLNILGHLHVGHVSMPDDWGVLAQFKETDISGDVGKVWSQAVKKGQVWAFLLGAIFGYLAKTFTTYG